MNKIGFHIFFLRIAYLNNFPVYWMCTFFFIFCLKLERDKASCCHPLFWSPPDTHPHSCLLEKCAAFPKPLCARQGTLSYFAEAGILPCIWSLTVADRLHGPAQFLEDIRAEAWSTVLASTPCFLSFKATMWSWFWSFSFLQLPQLSTCISAYSQWEMAAKKAKINVLENLLCARHIWVFCLIVKVGASSLSK